jgi:hypothetical protein
VNLSRSPVPSLQPGNNVVRRRKKNRAISNDAHGTTN